MDPKAELLSFVEQTMKWQGPPLVPKQGETKN